MGDTLVHSPFDIFLFIQGPLKWLITTLTDVTHNYGIAIVLFTVIIRVVLSPLYVAQIRSSKKMMLLSPKLKELQKRHGKDRESLTRETMLLYKEYNTNPALGCVLPLLQAPILLSLFYVLRDVANHNAHLHNVYTNGFLWLNHLGTPDQFHILPIVAGITQWTQQRMMLQPSSDPQQRQMNQIMQFLPLMIVVFAWSYASGLAVYWVTSNIIMIIMQYLISGWGQLWTNPMTLPTPDGSAPPPSPSRVRAFTAPREEATPARGARAARPLPQDPVEGEVVPETDGSSKMERYQARHGRGAARGRPSARGAKK